jgi:hypothetical protein
MFASFTNRQRQNSVSSQLDDVTRERSQSSSTAKYGLAHTVRVRVLRLSAAFVVVLASLVAMALPASASHFNTSAISVIAPSAGPTSGGTSILISVTGGATLTGATVIVNGNNCPVTQTTTSSITCTTPTGVAGEVSITVTTTSSGSLTDVDAYTYVAAPTVSSVVPSSGPAVGGTTITIDGSNLALASVLVNGAVCNLTNDSASTLTCATPSGETGQENVVIVTAGGSVTDTDAFEFVAAPSVSFIVPIEGPAAGGASVSLSGFNLSNATVTLGGSVCNVTSNTSTSISCTTPAGTTGPTIVVVTTPGGLTTDTTDYTYVAAPTISSVLPSSGPTTGGTPISIIGTALLSATGVTVGGTTCSITSDSSSSITCSAPTGTAGPVAVDVTTAGGTVSDPGGFTYGTNPTVSSVTPSLGPIAGGTAIAINGANLSNATVTVGGATCVVSFTSTSTVSCTTPSGTAGAADVVVTTGNGTVTDTAGFTYLNPTTISSVSPTSGSTGGGTTITVDGTNLEDGSVTVGGSVCTIVTDVESSVTCATPVGSVGPVDVVVTAPGGVATDTDGFTYTDTPSVSLIAPSTGPTSGDITMEVTGENLEDAAVTVGGSTCTISSDISTMIVCSTPSGSAGPATVLVTADSTTVTLVGGFTYVAPPELTDILSSVGPSLGPTSGGTVLTLEGSNLTSATVTMGGNLCDVTSNSATSVTCTTPPGNEGPVDVTVITTGGTATIGGAFTYVAELSVSSVSPGDGPSSGGTSITISGTNLLLATVTVAGAICPLTSDTPSVVVCTTPAGESGPSNVAVTTTVGAGNAIGAFTYVAEPIITAISPKAGPIVGGTTIDIAGTNLSNATATVAGVSCNVLSDTETLIRCLTPTHVTGDETVVVTTIGGSVSDAQSFTYVAVPTFSSIHPNVGPTTGGTTIQILGAHLIGASVTIRGAACRITETRSAWLTCVTHAAPVGPANVKVTTPGGSATFRDGFTYETKPK